MKKTISFIGILFLVLVAVLVARTLSFTSADKGSEVEKVDVGLESQAALSRFAKALTFPTISNANGELVDWPVFIAFREYLEASFPRTFAEIPYELVNEHSLLFRWEGRDKALAPILLLAHQDVVPVVPGTEEEWTHPPYAGDIADGFVWGRGAVDDKASVVGILEAVETLLRDGFTPERTTYLAFGHDEEVSGKQGAMQIAKKLAAEGVQLAFLLDEGGAIARDVMPGTQAVIAAIGPAEKGFLSLELTARSLGGHSSQPPAHTAVGLLARAIVQLENNPLPADLQYIKRFVQALGDNVPFYQRMMFANLWLLNTPAEKVLRADPQMNAMMRTTTAATMISGSVRDNVLPIEAKAVVNFRILPGDTIDSVVAMVSEIIDDENIEINRHGFSTNPSPVADTGSSAYKLLEKTVWQVVGSERLVVAPKLVVGATDARYFDEVSDASFRFIGLELGPDEIAGFHGTNEKVATESYLNAVKVYYQLIKNAQDSL